MSDVVIQCEGLGKSYLIGHEGRAERYTALRDVIARHGRNLWNRTRQALRGQTSVSGQEMEEFWALKDVSFDVQRGEVVGIIGRNGAGKSTLLKVLSRITEPTEGRVTLRGRVASLLEVGTGFHPELTGRENVFLNGAILGMSRAEIKRKFDEIVAFAEVEKFLDTPVKRYSSGMYVRLAFAVAAHLEPEILIVDEVLAVGDAEFQKKCLGKMGEVAKGGRTVLFVSHQMAAVENLCRTGLMFFQGQLIHAGAIRDVISSYASESRRLTDQPLDARSDRDGTGVLRFGSVSLRDNSGRPVASFTSGSSAGFELVLARSSAGELRNVRVAIGIDDSAGQRIVVLSTHLAGEDFVALSSEVTTILAHVPRLTLGPGRYGFTLFASVNGEVADWIKNAGSFDVEAGDFYGTGKMLPPGQGVMLMDHQFEVAPSKPFVDLLPGCVSQVT